MSRRKGRPMRVASPLPICRECPFRVWCSDLNFRNLNQKGEQVKVCPVWWMLVNHLREKGILKAPPITPIPISKEEGRAILDAARRQRTQRLAG